jgi:required for meiotic nuclear division protein 1
MKISAYFIAEQIQLKTLRESYTGEVLQENPSELFYRIEADQYMYVFDFGVVVFANMPDVDSSKNLLFLRSFCTNPLEEKVWDDYTIHHRPDSPFKVQFDDLVVPLLYEDVIKIVMFNLAQSVALDHFANGAQALLQQIKLFANEMELKGQISIGRKNMVRFIGKALNSKNRIVENLFIFDSPEQTWNDEYLDKIHKGLVQTLDLPSRFREIEYTNKVIEDNLAVLRELFLHRESSKMEWIIIVLICIEVLDLFVSKLF